MKRTLCTAAAAVALVSACADQNGDLGGDRDVDYALVTDMLPDGVTDVDILFVIDDSGSMSQEQGSLATWASNSLFGVLGGPDGALLDLHVAVVSTDLAGGEIANVSGCTSSDDGVFQSEPFDGQCPAPTGHFLYDVDDGAGGRDTNFSGTMSEAFACIAQLGIEGCGFEQPLEAMRRALDGSNPENDGFLRPNALLAVVFVTDEDDCSMADTAMFDPADMTLGPLTSFRCFADGVVCDPDDPLAPGAKTDCQVRDQPQFLFPVDEYVDFLTGLKPYPGMVVVGGIMGDPTDVHVSINEIGNPQLEASCTSSWGGDGAPAIRLQALLDAFPAHSRFSTICSDDDMSGPLESVAMNINDTSGRSPCVRGDVADFDPDLAGVQAVCRAFEVVGAERIAIEACDGGDTGCFSIVEDAPACRHTATGLAVAVSDDLAGAGHHIQVECGAP